MKIPYERLSPEILENLIKEFVMREGTDYGERECTMETKMKQVMTQIRSKEASIYFDSESESFTIQ